MKKLITFALCLFVAGALDAQVFVPSDGSYVGTSLSSANPSGVCLASQMVYNYLTGHIWTCKGAPGSMAWLDSGAPLSAGNSTVFAAQTALRATNPTQGTATAVTPTISLANANPGSTPTAVLGWLTSPTSKANPAFTLLGGNYYQFATTFPYTNTTAQIPMPVNTVGFGVAQYEFFSDAPILTFQQQRSNSYRVIVDGQEQFRVNANSTFGTAAAGSASTITLGASANSTVGYYINDWVHTTGGTGAGQYAQITTYAAAKLATISPNWATAPDATTTYEVTQTKAAYSDATQTGFTTYYFTLSWNGERRLRRYHVDSGYQFPQLYVGSALDSVLPAPRPTGTRAIWFGDSYSAGTGSDNISNNLARVACDLLGWDLWNQSIGGTGYLNGNGTAASSALTLVQRITPPANAWVVKLSDTTAGTYTLTQAGVTTAALNYNDTAATLQTKIDTAFGVGNFAAIGGGAASMKFQWFVGLGGNAPNPAPMSANFGGLTGGAPTISQYLGDLAPSVPRDGAGVVLPFVIVLAAGHNDTTDTNTAWLPSLLQSTVTSLIQSITTTYPQARVFVVGSMFLPGGSIPTATTAADAALLAATTAAAPTINGRVPFVETLNPAWFTGTGYAGSLQANGNSDLAGYTDGIHPSAFGHFIYGSRLAQAFLSLVNP